MADVFEQQIGKYVAAGRISPRVGEDVLGTLRDMAPLTPAQAVAKLYEQQHGQTEKLGVFVDKAKDRGYWK